MLLGPGGEVREDSTEKVMFMNFIKMCSKQRNSKEEGWECRRSGCGSATVRNPGWQEEQDGCQAGRHAEESGLGPPNGTGRVCSKRETCLGVSGNVQNVNCACDIKGGRGCCKARQMVVRQLWWFPWSC